MDIFDKLHLSITKLKQLTPEQQFVEIANALGGIQVTIDPMVRVAAKTIGATLLDLFTQPALLDSAKREFQDRTGGGIGGSRWVAPLLPADFKVPHQYRWPEYVTTMRGEEWTIPWRDDE